MTQNGGSRLRFEAVCWISAISSPSKTGVAPKPELPPQNLPPGTGGAGPCAATSKMDGFAINWTFHPGHAPPLDLRSRNQGNSR